MHENLRGSQTEKMLALHRTKQHKNEASRKTNTYHGNNCNNELDVDPRRDDDAFTMSS